MENFDEFSYSCSQYSQTNETVNEGSTGRKPVRTICDISNVLSNKSKKLRKSSVVQKYRRVYLKKYACTTGIRHYRRYKKAFLIPVVHVSRRPDNPFNVKTVVENLRRKQMTSPLHKASDSNQHLSAGEELCYSNLEQQGPKTKNWEAIRYKYQLDYKEKLKMERENYFNEYSDMKKMSQKSQSVERMRPFHQTVDECIRKAPRNAVVSDEEPIINSLRSNRHIGDRQKNFEPSNGPTSIPDESKKYYLPAEYANSVRETVDSTEDSIPVPQNELKQMRFTRNERQNNIHSEVNQNKISIDSNTVVVPTAMGHQMPRKSQCEDFDFTIPFNESNILVKVMAPERKKPNVATQHKQQLQQPSLLQDTLLYDTKSQRESTSSKRATLDEHSKTDTIRPDSSSKSEWLQYIQNILNRTPHIVGQPAAKSHTNEPISKGYFDHRPIPITTTIQQTNVPHAITTIANNSQMTRYHDPSTIGRVKLDRPVPSNPRLIRPKVMHPTPYFRSDFLRNNPLYKEQMEDPVMVNMPVRRLSPVPMIHDQPNVPPHMEYVYANHPSYHPEFMVRNMRLPMDMPHANLMGPPTYYDQTYVQYPTEMERMPNPYIDRFIPHHNMNVPPVNRSIGYLPPRPTASGVYRYLNPQHDHPLWIYPHMMER